MIFRFIKYSLFSPKKIIDSDMCGKYDFFKINIVYLILIAITACINVRINLSSVAQIDILSFLYSACFLSTISYLSVYLPILIIYFLNNINNHNRIKLYVYSRYLFPFFGSYRLIGMWIVLLFNWLSIQENFYVHILSLLPKICLCYPVYLFLKKQNLSKNNTYFILISYLLLILFNVI